MAPKPIKMNKPKSEVLRALKDAREHLDRAIELAADGYLVLAHDEMAKLFNDENMLPAPGRIAVDAELGRMARAKGDEKGQHGKPSTVPGVGVGLGLGAAKPPIPVRSWAP